MIRKQLQVGSKIYRFAPLLDEDGLLRVGGRWQMTTWKSEKKHPTLLGKHYLTEVLVRHYHLQRLHEGVEGLLAFLRNTFWILSGRRIIRQVKSRCITCKRLEGRPCGEVTAPLPSGRVSFQRPFAVCGVDYAAPLMTRDRAGVCKIWLALFVCAASRALHLEMVTSLSMEDFLLAFRRFIARQGQPEEMISDNGSNFKAAAKVLRLRWTFNPPSSPWFGGFFERLVRAVKEPLRKVLGRSLLRQAELATLITEVERMVNRSRPLTHVGGEQEWEEPPVTPNQLLGRVWKEGPSDPGFAISQNGESLTARVRHLRQVYGHLKQRWESEYVSQLRLFNHRKGKTVHEGEIVLIVDTQRKRSQWRLARVLKLFEGRDGKVRVAEVKAG